MTTSPFSENLLLVLKMLSMSSAQLASGLEIDKSVVSRWLKGTVQPSSHNLARLSMLVATRVPGFRMLDWERDRDSLVQVFGADPDALPGARDGRPAAGLTLPIWDQMLATAALRASAYEGFFRSTRPHPQGPGQFIHDHGMMRRDDNGLLRLYMGSAGTVVEGWMIPLHNQIYAICADVTSGALLFGIFNGVGTQKVDVYDGLTLTPSLDVGRTPTAMAMICERVGDLTGDREADDRRFAELAAQPPLAPEGSVPEHIVKHLVRDIGPAELAKGGDWLLQMPLVRSLARGPAYTAPGGG